MFTRTLATLGLALALGTAGAHAAQPVTQPVVAGEAAAPMQAAPAQQPARTTSAKTTSAKTTSGKPEASAKVGTATGTRIGATKLNSGRSVAAHKPAHHRLHVSAAKAKTLRHAHVAHRSLRTHMAHVAKKGGAKHA